MTNGPTLADPPSDATTAEDDSPSAPALARPTISGDRHAKSLLSSGGQATGSSPSTPANAEAVPVKKSLTKDTIRIRLALESSIEAAKVAQHGGEDPVLKANAVNDLSEALERLWQLRSKREVQFGDMIAHLQGLLMGMEPEDLPTPHIEAIRRVLHGMAVRTELTDPDAQDLESILIKAGCDVFREID